MSFLKRITSFLILGCVVSALVLTAGAVTVTGSIRLHLTCGGKPVPGGTLTLYRVGESAEGAYALCDDFVGSGADLTKLDHPDTARILEEYALAQNITGQTLPVDASGTVRFAPLDLGLYLIAQSDAAGGYEPIRSFLVTIPLTVGGDVWYDIDASPKVALTPGLSEPTTPTEPTDPWLPQTGQLNWPVAFLALVGIMLFVLGMMLRYIRKHEESES